MKNLLPQEMQIRYLFPVIRKEIALQLQNEGLKQKEISETMGLTEAAVSQYLNNKRGNELKLTSKEKKIIKDSIKELTTKKARITEYLIKISKKIGISKKLCEIHHSLEDLPHDCKLCKKIFN